MIGGPREAAAQVADADALLSVRDLAVSYGTGDREVPAVRGVSFDLHRGELLGIAGESGCGKSTLAFAVARLLRGSAHITGGRVLWYPGDGTAPIDLATAEARVLRDLRWAQLAIVMQSAMNALNPVLPLRAQIGDVIKAHQPDTSRRERVERTGNLLEMVGISAGRAGAYPHELSGGMRQRAAIALALALTPQLVIMDEPTTALDVVMQRQVIEQLAQLRERLGFAVIFITHDLSLLIEIADRIMVMYAGTAVEVAEAQRLYANPLHPYSFGLLNSFPKLQGPRANLHGIPGTPPDPRRLPTGCPFHPRCPRVMDVCRSEVPPLRPRVADGLTSPRDVACLLYADARQEAPHADGAR